MSELIHTYVLHRIDPNDIASTERWYMHRHGPQIARRYGPWLARFESYRPVELPRDARGYGIANYLDTEGWWSLPLPNPDDRGFLGMSQPPKHARPFSAAVAAQPEHDFKGRGDAPEDHFILRWVQLIEYPEGVDKALADRWYTETFAREAVRCPTLNRFFSSRTVPGVRLPGHWAEIESTQNDHGFPADHIWDRVTEMWFDDFDGWRRFVQSALPRPDWAETERFPWVAPDSHFVSSFLLETPAFDWLRIDRAVI